jgi:hypothetical protein
MIMSDLHPHWKKETVKNGNSPSQKMQSHEQRKQVVARGLLHLLHDRFDTGAGRPLELPGGIPVDEWMDIPVPTCGTIPDADMVELYYRWIATNWRQQRLSFDDYFIAILHLCAP